MSGPLEVDIAGGVMTVTLNRPSVRNAVNTDLSTALCAAMDRLDADPSLQVAVITGAGGAFSAGMDLQAFINGEDPAATHRGFAGLCTTPPAKPLIAAVSGWALAGGCEIALACDVIVADMTARFGLPEAKRGLLAAAGGLVRLPRRISLGAAMLFALVGDPVDAVEAHRIGLVDVLVAEGEAIGQAQALAARIAQNAPLSLMASKQTILDSADRSLAEAFGRQASLADAVAASDDAREGARAFLEKRSPVWTGA